MYSVMILLLICQLMCATIPGAHIRCMHSILSFNWPRAGAVEEATAVLRALDFQDSPPWLASLEREGPGGDGLRSSERDVSSGAEQDVGDNWMGTQCRWRGKESPTNSPIGIREGQDGLAG
jgi:hypothetical protein